MTDTQFQLLIGTIIGSMILIIVAVVIAARVLFLVLKEYEQPTNSMINSLTVLMKSNSQLLSLLPDEKQD